MIAPQGKEKSCNRGLKFLMKFKLAGSLAGKGVGRVGESEGVYGTSLQHRNMAEALSSVYGSSSSFLRDIHRATEVTVSPSPSRSRIHQPALLTEKGLA